MTTPGGLSGDQLSQLAAAVQALLGPPSIGEGFPNPVSSLFQAGNTVLVNSSGLFVYAGAPASGNLFFAIALTGGADAYGNTYVAGLNATQGSLTGVSITGSTLSTVLLLLATLTAPVITSPSITGGTISETAITFDQVGGKLLAYTSTTTTATITSGTTWTAPAGSYTQGKVECEGADAGGGGGNAVSGGEAGAGGGGGTSSTGGEAGAGGSYSCEPNYPLIPGTVYGTQIGQGGTGGTAGNAGQSGGQTAFDTANLTGSGVAAPGGQAGSGGVGGQSGGTSGNTISYPGGSGGSNPGNYTSSAGGGGRAGSAGPGGAGGNPTSNASPGAGGAAGAGTGGIVGSNGVIAATNGNSGNAGGAGAGASSGSTQFQKVYTMSSSGSYHGSDATSSPNGFMGYGTMYQGGETASGGSANGTMCSMCIINGNPATDLSGATIDQVLLRFCNLHSWYNSGMYLLIGYHADTSLPGVWSGNGTTWVGQAWIAEGATTTYDVTGSVLGAGLQSGAARALTLGYFGQPEYGLWNYGYVYGAGGSSSYYPLLTVNYHTGSAPKQAGAGANGNIKITYVSSQTLVAAISPAAGTDSAGNAYGAGYTGPVTAFAPGTGLTVVETPHSITPYLNSFWAVRTGGYLGQFYMLASGRLQFDFELQNTASIVAGNDALNSTALPLGYRPAHPQDIPANNGMMISLSTSGFLTAWGAPAGAAGAVLIQFSGSFPMD